MAKGINQIVYNLLRGELTENCRQYEGKLADLILEKIRSHLDENYNLEFKEGYPPNRKIGRTVSAFSNTYGGSIIFGIRDFDHEIVDLKRNLKDASKKIEDHLRTKCYPFPKINFIFFRTLKNKKVLAILIGKRKGINPVCYDGVYYKRYNKSSPMISYEEIAQEYKRSYIAKLSENFHLISHREIKKLYHYFKLFYKQNSEIDFLELSQIPKQDIFLFGKNGTGKTYNTLKIVNEIAEKSKQPFIVLLPKTSLKEINLPKVIKHNIVLLWNDLHKDFRSVNGLRIQNALFDIHKITAKNQHTFQVIGNYRIEESQHLKTNFFSSNLFQNARKIRLGNIENVDKMNRLISNLEKSLKLSFGEDSHEKREFLISNIINNNPTVGYIVSIFLLLKQLLADGYNNEISFEILADIPPDIKNIWKFYFKQLVNPQIKLLLKSIRFLNELNIPLRKSLVRTTYKELFQGNSLLFIETLEIITDMGWIDVYKDTIHTWDAQMEGIPLEIIDSLSDIYGNFYNMMEGFKVVDPDLYVHGLNAFASRLMQFSNEQNKFLALNLFQEVNELKENVVSLHGIGLCYRHLSNIANDNFEKKIDYLQLAITFYQRALSYESKSYEILSNLGAAYHEMAHCTPPGKYRIKYLLEGKKYYEKSLKIVPNFSIALLNMAGAIYQLPFNSFNEEFIWDKKTLDIILNYITQCLKYLPILNEEIREDTELHERIYAIRGATYFNYYSNTENELEILKKAFADAEKLYQLNPMNVKGLLLFAGIKFQLGRIESNVQFIHEAIDLCDRIIELKRWEPDVYIIKGNSLLYLSKNLDCKKKMNVVKQIPTLLEKKLVSSKSQFFETEAIYQLLALSYEILAECSNGLESVNFIKSFFNYVFHFVHHFRNKMSDYRILYTKLFKLLSKTNNADLILWLLEKITQHIDINKNPYLYLIRVSLNKYDIDQNIVQIIEDSETAILIALQENIPQLALGTLFELLGMALISQNSPLISITTSVIALLFHCFPDLDPPNQFINMLQKMIHSFDSDNKEFSYRQVLKSIIPEQHSKFSHILDIIISNVESMNGINNMESIENIEDLSLEDIFRNPHVWMQISLAAGHSQDPIRESILQYLNSKEVHYLPDSEIRNKIVNFLFKSNIESSR